MSTFDEGFLFTINYIGVFSSKSLIYQLVCCNYTLDVKTDDRFIVNKLPVALINWQLFAGSQCCTSVAVHLKRRFYSLQQLL